MPPRKRVIDTVVVGAGQSGLVASWHLQQLGREHVLLDRRATLGGSWLDRWDAFRLVSPNWTTSLPGFEYQGRDPDGFMPRDEVVAHMRAYAAVIAAPVELGTSVTRLRPLDGTSRTARFRLDTTTGSMDARQVVVAAGPFQVARIPPIATDLDPSVRQLHAHDYRKPEALPPGGVLVVGSGQTGVQLAEELLAAGRPVTLATGRCGRVPRTYRGRDIFWWLRALRTRGGPVGTPLPQVAALPDPRLRLACNPQASGHGSPPRDVDLREMALRGIRLAGRLLAIDGRRASFEPGLAATLEFADRFFPDRLKPLCDTFAERVGETLPPDDLRLLDHQPPEVTELDLVGEGITTVLWTTGYRPTFDWLELPVLDDMGLPRQVGGRTDVPGLTFLGSPWLVDMGSANLVGMASDAEALAPAWA